VPNAKTIDVNDIGKPKFLLVGQGGAGKTAQMLTLPGRTFAYLFDPSALSTLKGHDIEYEMFLPGKVNMAAQSLTKAKGDKSSAKKSEAGDVYVAWEKDFETKLQTGYFNTIDNICFDSFTTFSDVVMDRILEINGRPGHFPQQDDWTAQMSTIMNVVRTCASLNKVLVFTAHDEFKQDETTSRMQNVLMLTGKLKVKVPLVFSDIWHMECKATATELKYVAQTRPDRMNPNVRCSFRDLDMHHDVTIKDWKRPKESGIGRILKDHLGYNPELKVVPTEPIVTGVEATKKA
jgi:hypothetical protein